MIIVCLCISGLNFVVASQSVNSGGWSNYVEFTANLKVLTIRGCVVSYL